MEEWKLLESWRAAEDYKRSRKKECKEGSVTNCKSVIDSSSMLDTLKLK